MDEVAKKAGVSKTTVSRIINGNHAHVNIATKEKVLKVIEELQYRPNAVAKSLKQKNTNVIAIVLSNLQNPFWSSVLEGVEDSCHAKGYNLMICNANDNSKLEQEYIEQLQMKQVDGIIVNPTMKNKQLFTSLLENDYPLVAINRKIEEISVDTVAVNNVKGSMLAVNHLIKLGRKAIAMIVYPPEGISPRVERIEGYVKALEKNGFTRNDTLIRIIQEQKGLAKEEVKKLLTSNMKPDAIFSTNNMMTLEILEGIKELGLVIPRDISLIGYDETVWSKHLNPPLTTVNQPSYEMGKLAAERLIDRLTVKDERIVTITQLEPNLIIRESCGFKR